MESANSMFRSSSLFPLSPPSSTSLPSSSSSSVSMLHEQATPAVTSCSSSFAARNFPTSVLLQEQHDEYRPLLHMYKEDKTSQATLNTRQMNMASVHEKNNIGDAYPFVDNFMQQLHLRSHLQNILTSSPREEITASSIPQPVTIDSDRPAYGLKSNAVSLAKQALLASKQAASVAKELKSVIADDADPLPFSMASTSLANCSLGKNKVVRSTRLLERKSKQRKVPKSKVLDKESYLARKSDAQGRLRVEKTTKEGFGQNDPLRLFLWGPETKQLLTVEEESQLISQLQDLSRLEEVKMKLQSQFGRQPTLAEWAESVGLSCQALQTRLDCGYRSREKLITANLRMVVHIAKNYLGRGLSLQDLLQEGSMGLMKSVERFKPQAGCRFGTYAYWWVRQTIRKAIFLHSRTIRLPENLYTLLGKVIEAKKLYIHEGNLRPTKEELAERVGITVNKLENLLFAARIPLSMQQTVWAGQDTTFQEITADSAFEIPDVSVSKLLMRRHVCNILNILSPKERRIIRLRFGIEDGHEKSLSDIGKVFGLTKERVRQLESRALDKLKQCLVTEGLDAYIDLIV
ncbi:putative RNA polymerase sigma-70 like domain, RNA polymerase sigma factor, SigB/C/D/F, plastid [Lupinus albus]|uniref:RNA polymerase sigma factor n=1 Tax=Lupinus albus TaxID=3870 RepID=A0A6A4NAX0_LUPAL|nr:putative RNA polymerase sigma-70 like domain, RNA polymerase sigma factor, SigB/C/D/F, plastid [Lupinus albus]